MRGKHENGVFPQAVFSVSYLMIFTQTEKTHPISTNRVRGVRGEGVQCVDDASLQMCSSRDFLRLEQHQQLNLEAKTAAAWQRCSSPATTALPCPTQETNYFTLYMHT